MGNLTTDQPDGTVLMLDALNQPGGPLHVLVASGAAGGGVALSEVSGIEWTESIPGNSYVVKNLGALSPAALANGLAIASFSGSDINVGLVIDTAEINSSGHLVIQILNTIPASVGPPITPEGDVTVLYQPGPS